MSLWAPLLEVTKPMAKQATCTSFPRSNIPDVHPAAIISAFHQNIRNRKMREELAMNKVKDVAELYVLANRCAQAEEERKYPGEDTSMETNSTDKVTAALTKKGRRRNRKGKGKTMLAVEGSDNT